MLNSQVLEVALTKKNKEVDNLQKSMESQKKEYDQKIKHLMSSIEKLKSESQRMENDSKDNIRVNIIKKLNSEIKDQEQVIMLIRKLHGKDKEVDEYLMAEFSKGICNNCYINLINRRITTYANLRRTQN